MPAAGPDAPPTAPFALALLALDGVGRVTVHRILERFPSADALRRTPREQVLLRLKGAPHAERTVERLFSDALDRALAAATAETDRLAATGVRTLAPGDAAWPAGLGRLARADRPAVLYGYGNPAALGAPLLTVFGRPPVAADAFEAAQRIARRAAAAGAGVVTGAANGFDVALQKVATGAGRAPVAVVASGLATLAPSLRPAATALPRAGGVLLSPFPMAHGPFPHDDRERALVQAALAQAVVAAAPAAGSPERRACAWASEAGVPVAVVGEVDTPADGAAADEPWLRTALRADDASADAAVLAWLGR